MVALILFCAGSVTPALAQSSTEVGASGALGFGQHVGSDYPVPVTGIVPAGFLEVTQHLEGVRIDLQGIPTVAASGTSRGAYGHSVAKLSLLDAVVMVDTDRSRRFRLGTGLQVINLSNVNGVSGEVNSARIASQIYAAGSTFRLPRMRFLDFNLYAIPNVRTNLHVTSAAGVTEGGRPEQGAELYYSAAYGWSRGSVTYRVGFAGLSYHTRDTTTGELVDRNVGGGPMFEVRYHVGNPQEGL
jgi:hypothetical protein